MARARFCGAKRCLGGQGFGTFPIPSHRHGSLVERGCYCVGVETPLRNAPKDARSLHAWQNEAQRPLRASADEGHQRLHKRLWAWTSKPPALRSRRAGSWMGCQVAEPLECVVSLAWTPTLRTHGDTAHAVLAPSKCSP